MFQKSMFFSIFYANHAKISAKKYYQQEAQETPIKQVFELTLITYNELLQVPLLYANF
jgi:hypothetical protein